MEFKLLNTLKSKNKVTTIKRIKVNNSNMYFINYTGTSYLDSNKILNIDSKKDSFNEAVKIATKMHYNNGRV